MEIPKILLIDFGDVIGFFDILHFDKFIEQNGGDELKIRKYFKDYKKDFDKDEISEKNFWTNLRKITNVNLPWEIISENNKKNLVIDYRMINLIKKIPIKKILFSNMDRTTVQQIKKELNLSELFDEIIFSCEVGNLKTDKLFLKNLIKRQSISPDEILLVDDSKNNLKKCEELGFETYLFKDYEKFKLDFTKLFKITS